MNKNAPADPLRARCLELCEELNDHTQLLRDFALTPKNAWLAKGELRQVARLISELETVLEDIDHADGTIA